MMAGIVAAQRISTGGGGVQFVAASGTTYVTATSQDQTVPASVAAGDLLLAVVMHRGTLTPASGWTLVATRSCTAVSTTQYTSVYQRTAQAGDASASTTWTQATSARLAIHIVAFRKPDGCSVLASNVGGVNETTTSVITWAGVTGSSSGQLALVAGSIIIANTAGATAMATSSGTLTTPDNVTDNRMAAAYLPVSAGQAVSGTFTSSTALAVTGTAAVSVLIG